MKALEVWYQTGGTCFAGDLKNSSHVHLVTGFWGDNSGLTDLSVQKLNVLFLARKAKG